MMQYLPALIAVGISAAALASDDIANVYLITHSEVEISASPTAIWPYILDTSEWKTLAEKTNFRGEPDQLGEIEMVRGESNGVPYEFYVETIELTEEKRKVIAIYFDEEAKGDVSYSAWTLFPGEHDTRVTYDVYSINRIPEITPEQVPAVREQIVAPNQTRFDAELRLLKQLVERSND